MSKCRVCDAVLINKATPESRRWDWFTGFLGSTVHFCPKHNNSPERNRLFKLSRKEPDGYERDKNKRHSIDV